MKKNELEEEKITKLIRKFAVPCVISMLVAALYNIVDQIFIGWSSAGAYGNAATNIVYPFTVISLAFALLIGDGSAALFSLSQGAKDKEKTNKSIGNGLVLLIVTSIILTIVGLLFNKQILGLFGGNPNELECYNYAKDYLRINKNRRKDDFELEQEEIAKSKKYKIIPKKKRNRNLDLLPPHIREALNKHLKFHG